MPSQLEQRVAVLEAESDGKPVLWALADFEVPPRYTCSDGVERSSEELEALGDEFSVMRVDYVEAVR